MGVCFGLAWLVGVAGWPPTQHKTRPPQKGHHSNCSSRRDLDVVFFSDSNRHDDRDEGQREEEGGEGEGEGDGQLEEGGRDEGYDDDDEDDVIMMSS